VANRNALLAGLAGVLALIAHDRWRREGWRAGALLGPFLFGLGMLCGESAVAITGFVFAYAVTLDRGTWRRRLATLVPYGLVLVAWQLAYSAYGYGVEGSGIYVHPIHDTSLYLLKAAERVPILLAAQWGPVPSDVWVFLPSAAKAAVFGVALLTLWAMWVVARVPLQEQPALRFWLVSMMLSTLPIAASLPSDRLLVFVGMGGSALVAASLVHHLDHPPAARWRRGILVGLVGLHVVLAPLLLPLRALSTWVMSRNMTGTEHALVSEADVASKTLTVVSFASATSLGYMRWRLLGHALPTPAHQRVLSAGLSPVTVTRVDLHTLRVHPEGGFLPSEPSHMLRGPQDPMWVGQTIELSDVTVTVQQVLPSGLPEVATFRFREPLEHPSRFWMRGERWTLVPWTPPPVGETVVVPTGWSSPPP
jgi:hypothetical protein